VLAGPAPRTLIDPINPDDIRQAVKGILHEWWFPLLDDLSWQKNHGSEYHAYTILTMCRALRAVPPIHRIGNTFVLQWVSHPATVWRLE